jgi:hypothetical protein
LILNYYARERKTKREIANKMNEEIGHTKSGKQT